MGEWLPAAPCIASGRGVVPLTSDIRQVVRKGLSVSAPFRHRRRLYEGSGLLRLHPAIAVLLTGGQHKPPARQYRHAPNGGREVNGRGISDNHFVASFMLTPVVRQE